MKRIDKYIAAPIVVIVVAVLSMFIIHGHYARAITAAGMPDTTVMANHSFNISCVKSVNYYDGTYSCVYFDKQETFEPTCVYMDKYTFKALLSVITALDSCDPYSDEYTAILDSYKFVLWINLGTGAYYLSLPESN